MAFIIVAFAACGPEGGHTLDDTDATATNASIATEEEAPPPMPPPKRAAGAHEGSAISRGVSEDALYIADEDHGVIRRVALPITAQSPGLEIPTPGAPAQVLALDGRVLVTIRDPGMLLILRPDAERGLVEASRVKLPDDAWGIAVTPDEKTALVSSAWTHRITAIDLDAAKTRWTADVRREPRAIVVRPDGASAYVTHLVGAALTRIDGIDSDAPETKTISFAPAPLRTPVNARAKAAELDASLAYSAVLAPDGDRLFVPRHALGALGKQSWFGQPTVDVLLTSDDSTFAPPRDRDGMLFLNHDDIPDDIGISSDGAVPVQMTAPFVQPRAAVYRRSTRTILVAGEGSNDLAELDAMAIDPSIKPLRTYSFWDSCGAPSGIALSADESEAYLACRTSNGLAAVHLDSHRVDRPTAFTPPTIVHLADDTLSKRASLGRKLFYDATNWSVSGGLGCAGCHPEGRDDGHVHQEVEHQAGSSLAGGAIRGGGEVHTGFPRQTPMLAGRVAAEGPYGWHGQSKTLEARLMLGFGLHRWSGWKDNSSGDEYARAIATFLREGLVAPPRPDRPLTAEEDRGQKIFLSERAACSSCHVPATGYTDRAAVELGRSEPRPGFDAREEDRLYKTPSLFFVGGTAPYYHDGRAATLEELIEKNHDRMGHTDHLSTKDRAALIAFLRTL